MASSFTLDVDLLRTGQQAGDGPRQECPQDQFNAQRLGQHDPGHHEGQRRPHTDLGRGVGDLIQDPFEQRLLRHSLDGVGGDQEQRQQQRYEEQIQGRSRAAQGQ